MEIKNGDYVRYKGRVYSVIRESSCFDLISYKDLEILENIPRSELERLTDFHVSVMRYNKTLPKRRFKIGDEVKIRGNLDSECVYNSTFRIMGFSRSRSYTVTSMKCIHHLKVNGYNIHEFEVELVD